MPLPARLIQQQRPRYRGVQTLNPPRAGNRHPLIAHRQPLHSQPGTFIPNHQSTSRSEIHLRRRYHASTPRSNSRNQPHPTPLQPFHLRCIYRNHRHPKHTPNTSPQRLLVPRTHRPRSRQHPRRPKSLRRPHQRPQVPRILQPHRNQNQQIPTRSHHIVQHPHRRHQQRSHTLRRLRLHHTPKHFLRQPHHLHPTRHCLRDVTTFTHEHTLQHHPTPQRLLQQVIPLNRDQPTTQPRIALKRRPQLLHPRIRPARNYLWTHPRILPLHTEPPQPQHQLESMPSSKFTGVHR
jgi:hypothetical protein